jgi:hypothetical protein
MTRKRLPGKEGGKGGGQAPGSMFQPEPEELARPVPRGYATRSRPLRAGRGARVAGGSRTGPTPREITARYYEVMNPAPATTANEREALRARAIVEARAGSRATPLRSDYFGTAEHRAAAEYLAALLAGKNPFPKAHVDQAPVLLRAPPGAGPGEAPVELAAAEVVSADPAWRDQFTAGLADLLEVYQPLRELELRPGITLCYGEILALAGDYYESPASLEEEITPAVREAIHDVTPDADGTFLLTAHRGIAAYLDLARRNDDHFACRSWLRYARHHAEALGMALDRDLERALVRNAFADHFLTDAFASGHLRVPRDVLRGRRQLAAYAMHAEENRHGLWLQDGGGLVWRGYGDDGLGRNPVHATLVARALGTSIQRVYAAYRLAGDPAAALRTAVQGYAPPDLHAGAAHRPAAVLPAFLGSLGGLPDLLSLIPVPLPARPAPQAGWLANYPPRCVLGEPDRRKEPDFEAWFQVRRA